MKFAFDVDGVILENPNFFSVITKSLKDSGHYIYIVTDFDEYYRKYREQELKLHNIYYDELVITSNKQQFFLDNNIDFAIDDDIGYYPNLSVVSLFLFKK